MTSEDWALLEHGLLAISVLAVLLTGAGTALAARACPGGWQAAMVLTAVAAAAAVVFTAALPAPWSTPITVVAWVSLVVGGCLDRRATRRQAAARSS